MTEISTFTAASEAKRNSLFSKKDSVSDIDVMAETQVQERVDVPVTSVASADDSRGLTTPDCDSIELKLTPVSRWASVQEALEACLDPFFLAGQSSVKDDRIAEELIRLLDTSLTAHVPALAGLSFLQPFFSGVTRSERLDAVLRAARASNKLLLRDDLPVPSTSGLMLSIDEAEAAGLRVGPRSHAEGVNRSVLLLERKHGAVDGDEVLRSFTLAQLQATVPQHTILKVDRSESPCVVRAVFVTPAAADRAYTAWRTHAPHSDIRVTRVSGGTSNSNTTASRLNGRSLPVPPRSTSEVTRPVSAATTTAAPTLTVPAPRTALKCPRVVGESPSPRCSSSSEGMVDASGKAAGGATAAVSAPMPAPRAVASVPQPPPAIDAGLPAHPLKSVVPPAAASSDPSTTSTTPSPESSSTAKSKFNMNATPFLPKSVLDAQMVAATAGAASGPSAAGWWQHGGSWARRAPGCENVTGSAMDTSEALANQMLMDSSSGWMYPGLDPYNGSVWANKFTSGDGWGAEGGVCGDVATAASITTPAVARKESPLVPERPKAVGGDIPVALSALGDSPRLRGLQPVGGMRGCTDVFAPRQMAMSLPPEATAGCGNAAFDSVSAARTSPLLQTSPVNLSTSRRHRHDPYSPTGFVLCAESSCASSLTPQAGNASTSAPASNKLLFAGSLTSERMAASFCFEDPLIKASARRRERRRQMQESEDGAARTSSSSASEHSSAILKGSQSGHADMGSSSSNRSCGSTGDAAVHAHADVAASKETAEAAAEATEEVVAAVESPAPAPKSYAEALRLKAKATGNADGVSSKSAELKKEKSTRKGAGAAAAAPACTSAIAADKKAAALVSKAGNASAAKSLPKPKKTAVTA